MMMNLIAELSKGEKTPDGKPVGMPQRIIYQCSEDGVSDTIKPRLERCGADCRKVAFINEETYSGLSIRENEEKYMIIGGVEAVDRKHIVETMSPEFVSFIQDAYRSLKYRRK